MKTFNRRGKLQLDASYHVVCKINRDEIIFNNPVAALLLNTIARRKEKFSFRIHNFRIFEYIVKNSLKAKLAADAKDYRHSGLYYHQYKLESIVTEESRTRELFEQCKDFHQ